MLNWLKSDFWSFIALSNTWVKRNICCICSITHDSLRQFLKTLSFWVLLLHEIMLRISAIEPIVLSVVVGIDHLQVVIIIEWPLL